MISWLKKLKNNKNMNTARNVLNTFFLQPERDHYEGLSVILMQRGGAITCKYRVCYMYVVISMLLLSAWDLKILLFYSVYVFYVNAPSFMSSVLIALLVCHIRCFSLHSLCEVDGIKSISKSCSLGFCTLYGKINNRNVDFLTPAPVFSDISLLWFEILYLNLVRTGD